MDNLDIVQHFGKYVYSPCSEELNEKINITVMSALSIELEPGADYLSLAQKLKAWANS